MAQSQEILIDIQLLEESTEAAADTLKGLPKVLSSIADGVREAFSVKGFTDYKTTVKRFGKELADELLVLQLSFGKMKVAIAEAVSPIAAVFVPMLNQAIQAVIRFSGIVRQFLSGLIAGITGNQELAAASGEAASGQKSLASAAKSAGRAVRRSLAAFDTLERLNASTGGNSGTAAEEIWNAYVPDPISPQVQAMVDKVLAFLEPLRTIDLTPLHRAFQTLGAAFQQLGDQAAQSLSYLWQEVLTPFAAWVLEKLAPALTEGLAAKLELVAAATAPVREGLQALWEAMKPVVAYIGDSVIRALQDWKAAYQAMAQTFREKSPVITSIFQNIAQIATEVWGIVKPILTALGKHFSDVFSGAVKTVQAAAGHILDALSGLTGYLAGVFSGSWEQAWQGIKLFLKSVINGVIDLLNGMVSRLVSALNSVIKAANKLSFTVPNWVPGIGGNKFGVNMKTVSAPQIPYLAQGAVLPANKPFLAVVGDQRHGTNVEAPLATIQEAVAMVMEDQTGAILRGFEASLGVQREILEAVLGIHVGDEVLGRAVERYNRRMAVMQGGF